jgi:hypothetical protein
MHGLDPTEAMSGAAPHEYIPAHGGHRAKIVEPGGIRWLPSLIGVCELL